MTVRFYIVKIKRKRTLHLMYPRQRIISLNGCTGRRFLSSFCRRGTRKQGLFVSQIRNLQRWIWYNTNNIYADYPGLQPFWKNWRNKPISQRHRKDYSTTHLWLQYNDWDLYWRVSWKENNRQMCYTNSYVYMGGSWIISRWVRAPTG